jgi:hypothetical protein
MDTDKTRNRAREEELAHFHTVTVQDLAVAGLPAGHIRPVEYSEKPALSFAYTP